MVFKVCAQLCFALVEAAQQATILVAHLRDQEVRRAARGGEVILTAEHRAGLGQGTDHQPVPARQALVVGARAHAPRANFQQPFANPLAHFWRRLGAARLKDVEALKVTAGAGAKPSDRRVGVIAQSGAQLIQRPDVELALYAFGISVKRAVEAAIGGQHLAQRPVQRLLAGSLQDLVATYLPAVQVGARQ